MNFSEIVQLLHKYMTGDYKTNPDFLEKLLRHSYDENNTDIDPFTDKGYMLDDEKLSRTYSGSTKGGMTIRLAHFFVSNFEEKKLANYIDEKLKGTQIDDLENEINRIDYDFDSIDTAVRCSKIIYKSLKNIIEKKSSNKIGRLSYDLKTLYGNDLFIQEQTKCPNTSCRNRLYEKSSSGKTSYTYSVAIIDDSNAISSDNLIALCPNCYAKYTMEKSPETTEKMREIKKILYD